MTILNIVYFCKAMWASHRPKASCFCWSRSECVLADKEPNPVHTHGHTRARRYRRALFWERNSLPPYVV